MRPIGIAVTTALALSVIIAARPSLGVQPPVYPNPIPAPAAKRPPLDTISDWNAFFREFRAAVARRDRTALRSCMVKNFLFTLDDLEEYDGIDLREAAFKEWEKPRVKGWEALDRILPKGNCPDPMVPGLFVAPPQWVTDPNYTDYRVGFERRDGVWRWIWTMRGE